MNGGETWKNVIENVPEVSRFSPVSHIEPSLSSAGVAYCSFDRHMFDDFHPYVFKTNDFGRTWNNISGNLPDKAYVWVIREDPKNLDILYAGTELGLFASFSGGKNWIKLQMKNLPAVSVHDILIHPKENDLILGTHGRGMWIMDDISALQEIKPEILASSAYLFSVRPALRHAMKPVRYGIGDKVFRGANAPYGALITYYLKEKIDKKQAARIEILDKSGKVIRELKNLSQETGLNRVSWDLRAEGPRPRREVRAEEDFFFRGPRGPQVLPGNYTVRLTVNEKTYEKPLKVWLDPELSISQNNLETQQGYCLKLRDMQSLVNDGLRGLDMLRAQLEERKKILEKLGKSVSQEVMEVIDRHLQRIDSIAARLARPEGRAFWTEGPRLSEHLSSLFSSIDGVNAAPTNAQVQFFKELEVEFKEAMTELNRYLSQAGSELNAKFSEKKLPLLIIPEQIRLEEE